MICDKMGFRDILYPKGPLYPLLGPSRGPKGALEFDSRMGFFTQIYIYVLLDPCVNFKENRRGRSIGSKFSKCPSWGPRAPRALPMTSFCLENYALSNDMRQDGFTRHLIPKGALIPTFGAF